MEWQKQICSVAMHAWGRSKESCVMLMNLNQHEPGKEWVRLVPSQYYYNYSCATAEFKIFPLNECGLLCLTVYSCSSVCMGCEYR